MKQANSNWLDVRECAAYPKTTVRGIYCMVHRGQLTHYKRGRRVMFLQSDMDQLIFSGRREQRRAA